MRQDVTLIGSELARLVPFSLTARGVDYAVTLVEAPDVIARARAGATGDGWLVVFLDGGEAIEDCAALLASRPMTLFVTSAGLEPVRRLFIERDLPVAAEYEGAVPALAMLLAMASWADAATEAPQQPLTPGSAG